MRELFVVYAFEFLAVTVVLFGAITQIVMPLSKGTPIFPMFRKQRKLEKEVGRAREDFVEAELERDAAFERRRAEKVRRTTQQK